MLREAGDDREEAEEQENYYKEFKLTQSVLNSGKEQIVQIIKQCRTCRFKLWP